MKTLSIALVSVLLPIFFILGCESAIEKEYRVAEMEAKSENWRTALSRYEDLLKVQPSHLLALQGAREGARIATFEVKDYQRALLFYRHLVLYSDSSAENLEAQRQIIDIYFEHLQDYPRAIEEISRFLPVEKDIEVRIEYRVKLARSYFHMNNFVQASAEVEEILRKPESHKFDFDLKLLKANILTADKKYDAAVVILMELMQKWRSQAIRENVPMTLAVGYEEKKDFKAAIQILESVREEYAVPEYVDLRLKKLKERSMNQPGARGWKK